MEKTQHNKLYLYSFDILRTPVGKQKVNFVNLLNQFESEVAFQNLKLINFYQLEMLLYVQTFCIKWFRYNKCCWVRSCHHFQGASLTDENMVTLT